MFTPSPLIALIVFVVLGSVALLGYAVGARYRKDLQASASMPSREPLPDHRIEELRQELELLSSSSLGLAERVSRLANDVVQVRESLTDNNVASAPAAYSPAIKMAQRGCNVDELVTQFGLPRGEAELLRKLHGGEDVPTPRSH